MWYTWAGMGLDVVMQREDRGEDRKKMASLYASGAMELQQLDLLWLDFLVHNQLLHIKAFRASKQLVPEKSYIK